MHLVATSGGTETFPTKFASLKQRVMPHANYVGTLPQSNAPVFDIGEQAWPTVGVAADPVTRAQKRREATAKGNKIEQPTLAEEVVNARNAYNVELFMKQDGV